MELKQVKETNVKRLQWYIKKGYTFQELEKIFPRTFLDKYFKTK